MTKRLKEKKPFYVSFECFSQILTIPYFFLLLFILIIFNSFVDFDVIWTLRPEPEMENVVAMVNGNAMN